MPWFASHLGHESFGLLGVLSTLQYLLSFADLGFSPSITREISQAHERRQVQRKADLVATLGRALMLVVGVSCILPFLLAHSVADHWLQLKSLSPDTVSTAFRWMVIASGSQMMMSFHIAALAGIGRQGILNILSAGFATARTGGAVLLLLWGGNVEQFFVWFGIVGLAGWGACALVTRRLFAVPNGGKWRLGLLYRQRHFFGWTTVVLISGGVIGQLDRITISHLRPLTEFGSYSLILSLMAIPLTALSALVPVVTPLISSAWASGHPGRIRTAYWRSSALASILILPIPLVIMTMPRLALQAWSGDASLITPQLLTAARMLAFGMIAQCTLHIPWSLQVASGNTRRNAQFNLVAMLFLAPAGVLFTQRFGMIGAASIPLAYSLSMHLFVLPKLLGAIEHRKGEYSVRSVLIPIFSGCLILVLANFCVQDIPAGPRWINILFLMLLGGVAAIPSGLLLLRHSESLGIDAADQTTNKKGLS